MAKDSKLVNLTDIRQIMSFRNSRKRLELTDMSAANKNMSQKRINEFNHLVSRARTHTLDSYNWSQEFNIEMQNTIGLNKQIPKLILTEFQPEKSFNFDEATKTLATKVASYVPKKDDKGLAAGVKRGLVKAASTSLQRGLFTEASTPGNRDVVDGIAMTFVRKLLQGQYLNVYEIPFFGDEYLIADTKSGWSESGAETMLGKEATETLKENFNINFPMAPQWQKPDGGKVNWKNNFHLINDTTENLIRNFRFLNALASGNYWMQLGFMQQSPNVYDVYCPGRFHQYYCALSVKIDFKGKTRENKIASNQLKQLGYNGFVSSNINTILFPDAYEINIECNDLTPNNFNTYMDHMLGHEKITIGDKRDRIGALDVGKALTNTVGATVKGAASSAIKGIFGG